MSKFSLTYGQYLSPPSLSISLCVSLCLTCSRDPRTLSASSRGVKEGVEEGVKEV